MLGQVVDILDALEQFGGWAVVVWIVVWLTKKWEQRMGDMVDAFIDHEAKGERRHAEVLSEIRNLKPPTKVGTS